VRSIEEKIRHDEAKKARRREAKLRKRQVGSVDESGA
jgi:hypothetical protein